MCRLFDVEMAFIAVGETRKKLNAKYSYPNNEAIEKEILSLKEEWGSYDDLKKANVEGLYLLVKEQINSVLFIPIEAKNSKIQYLFLCNRKTSAFLDRLFTTYDLNFSKILTKYILPWLVLFLQKAEGKDRKIFAERFKRGLNTIIIRVENRYTNESTFKEDDISKELQEEDKDEIKALLKEAEEKIDMWYMPIVSLINEEIFGYEMLSRDITKGIPVFPKDIFERAKTLGSDALTQLDCLCIKKVFDKLRESNYPEGKFICINIHPYTIFDRSFEKIIKEISHETPSRILPWFIVFEIVETGLIADYERFKEKIAELLSYNIHFAADDHGEGVATDQRLLALSPNYVKVSGEFIDKLLTDNAVKEMMIGLVKATRNFRGLVIAETIRGYTIFS